MVEAKTSGETKPLGCANVHEVSRATSSVIDKKRRKGIPPAAFVHKGFKRDDGNETIAVLSHTPTLAPPARSGSMEDLSNAKAEAPGKPFASNIPLLRSTLAAAEVPVLNPIAEAQLAGAMLM